MKWPITSDHQKELNEIYQRLNISITSGVDDDARIEELRAALKQEKVVYDLKYHNATFDHTLADTKSRIQELSQDTSETGTKIDAIVNKFAKLVAEKKKFSNTLKTRWPVQDDIKALKRLYAQLLEVKKDVDKATDPWAELSKLKNLSEVSADYPGLNEIWQTWRDQNLGDVTEEKLGKNSQKIFQIKIDAENVFNLLKRLGNDADFNNNACNISPQFSESQWRHDIVAIFNDKRKSMIMEHLGNRDSASVTIKEKFESWRLTFCELANNFYELNKRVNAGFTLHSEWANATTNTLFEKWRMKLRRFSELRSLVDPLGSRIKKLRSIDNKNGRELVNQEKWQENYKPELLMTIWEKTRVLENWPASVEEIKHEATLRLKIRQLLPGIKGIDSAYAARVENQLNTDGEQRWLIGLEQLSGNDIEVAFALKDEFGVHPDNLIPKNQYNLLLYEFKNIDWDAYKEDEITTISKNFIKKVEGNVPIKNDPEIKKFLQELKATLNGEKVATDDPFKEVGPRSSTVGNELIMNVVNEGELIEYRWLNDVFGKDSFRFIRMGSHIEGESAPFYLGTTEVSLGLFLQVIARTDKWDEINAFISEEASDPYRQGPWLWDYDDENSKVTIRNQWVNTLI